MRIPTNDFGEPLITHWGVFMFCVWNICMAISWMGTHF